MVREEGGHPTPRHAKERILKKEGLPERELQWGQQVKRSDGFWLGYGRRSSQGAQGLYCPSIMLATGDSSLIIQVGAVSA